LIAFDGASLELIVSDNKMIFAGCCCYYCFSSSTMLPQHIHSVIYLWQLAGWMINYNLTSSAESKMEFWAHFGLSMSSVLLLWNQLVDNPGSRLPANAKLKHLF